MKTVDEVEFENAESTLDSGVCESCYLNIWKKIQPKKHVKAIDLEYEISCAECGEEYRKICIQDYELFRDDIASALIGESKDGRLDGLLDRIKKVSLA